MVPIEQGLKTGSIPMKESSFEVVEGKKQRQLQRKAAGVAFFWLQYIYISVFVYFWKLSQ